MYEKKRGESSVWYSYIKELDRQRGRGQYAVESPLLWTDEELESYLQGSPVLGLVRLTPQRNSIDPFLGSTLLSHALGVPTT
jgi:hypothetical protein